MKSLAFACLALIGRALAGCTSTVGSSCTDKVPRAGHRTRIRVAVLRLSDARPREEIEGRSEFLKWWDHTKDKGWEQPDVPEAISRAVALYLDATCLYDKVTYEPIRSEEIGPGPLEKLRRQGYQAVLVGRLEHFSGKRQWDLLRGGALSAAGVAGSIANFAMGHAAWGQATFRPIWLLSTGDGKVLWEAEAASEVTDRARLLETATTYANDALRVALARLAERLEKDGEQVAARLRVPREEGGASGQEESPGFFVRVFKGGLQIFNTVTGPVGEGADAVVETTNAVVLKPALGVAVDAGNTYVVKPAVSVAKTAKELVTEPTRGSGKQSERASRRD